MTNQKYISKLVLWGTALINLLITPFSFDPLNVSKFALLSVFGFALYSLICTTEGIFKDLRYRWILIASGAYIFLGVASLLATRTNLLQQIFGASGRHTGFLTYVALISFMLGAAFVSNKLFLESLLKFLFVTGLVSLTYGLIQVFNRDPLNWTNSFSPVIGFLGNPNFQSSFMAISAIAVFSMMLKTSSNLVWKVVYAIYILLALFSIYKSNSQQGFLVFGAGFFVILLFWIRTKIHLKAIFSAYLFLSAGVVIATALDILQKAPWASILYKESVSNRGDLWRAGWRMTLDHPFFGVGFDNYGDWYRRYRDADAISARGVDTISNAAHNVFLDVSTSGGFPLLIAYAVILTITTRAAFKLLVRAKSFDAPLAGVIGAWFAYVAQSLISINQIGLAIWGWVFSGAIIGYEISTRTQVQIPNRKTAENLGTLLIGGFLGMIIGLPPLIGDITYRNAIDSRQIAAVEKSAYQWPQNGDRMIQVAATFRDNKLSELAEKVARDATKFAPARYEAWQVLASIPTLSDEERSKALIKMKELDPYNPNLQ
jgi:O-antigen ligase